MLELLIIFLIVLVVLGAVLWAIPQVVADPQLARFGRAAILVVALLVFLIWLLQFVRAGTLDAV